MAAMIVVMAQAAPTAAQALEACRAAGRGDCAEVSAWFAAPPRPEDAPALHAGCDGGDAAACFRLGVLYTSHAAKFPGVDRLAPYRKACDGGVEKACQDLWALGGRPPAAFFARRFEKARAACEAGEARGCDEAVTWGQMSGAEVDVPALQARACALGHGSGCYTHGLRLLGRGDCARGEAALDRGCALGNPDACADRKRLKEVAPRCR